MRDVWERIENALERLKPGLAGKLNPPTTEDALTQAETDFGVALPADYRASALIHDGMRLYLIDSFRLLPIAAVIESWNLLGAYVKDGSLELGDSKRVMSSGPVRAQKWNRRWIPVANDGGGDARALDLDPLPAGTSGQVISLSRDRDAVSVLAPSYRSYLERFADDLEHDRYEATVEDGVLVEFRKPAH